MITFLLLSSWISELIILISSFEREKLLQQCWKGISMKFNLNPFLIISSMKVSMVYFFSSVHCNILIFLFQSFKHLSIEHLWGQLSCNHYFPFYLFSQLVPCFLVCLICTFAFVFLVLISEDFWKSLPVFWVLYRKIGLPINIGKCAFGLKVSFIYFKSFLLGLDFIIPCIMLSQKIHSEDNGYSFARGYKSFGNDIAMFVLLMESASWFA